MSFLDLHKLWSKVTPIFSVGSQLKVPVIQRTIILKQVVPIVVRLAFYAFPAPSTLSGTRYHEFAINLCHSLSLVAANLPTDHYHAEWDDLSLTAHESARAHHLKHNEPFLVIEDLSPKKPKSKAKAARKVLQSVEIVAHDEEPEVDKSNQDSGEDSFKEPPQPVKPPPAPESPVVKKSKAGPGKNSVAALVEKDTLPVTKKDMAPFKMTAAPAVSKKAVMKAGKANPCTQAGKHKCNEDISVAKSRAGTSNVLGNIPPTPQAAINKGPLPKKVKEMSKEEKAELGHKAAAKAPCLLVLTMLTFMWSELPTLAGWLLQTWTLSFHALCASQVHRTNPVNFLDLLRKLHMASHLVKAFDKAIEAAGCVAELLHDQVAEINGIVVAETALLEDVSAVNYILVPHQPKEPVPASDTETPVASGSQLVSLTYEEVDSESEEVQATLEAATDSPVMDTTGGLSGEASADDPDV
ncbi:hypothetical protein IW261DRAFT_1421780 [Armillaria novae-zelandiae]|uniref:Uncharacterized protein n=1 Tax=Armillaria novae-zelandiae TaxID=153914 RepID=A0AA39UBR2_9AGAR|nr:hypothetical protein IW261DRAFT_1421780 [Armillaria novae-zelandiae]